MVPLTPRDAKDESLRSKGGIKKVSHIKSDLKKNSVLVKKARFCKRRPKIRKKVKNQINQKYKTMYFLEGSGIFQNDFYHFEIYVKRKILVCN